MDSIGEQGSLSLEKTKLIDEVSSGYTYFEDGDVVFAKITPCFENGKGTLAKKLVNGIAFGTTELHVLRPFVASDGKFLYYLTCSDEFRKNGESWMYGAGGQKRVPEDFVKDYSFPFPPLSIQKAIATYLDKETSRIDALIAKKERQIELLEEKRQAIITRAITKGLDPNAKMKDSGVDWIGDVPEQWVIRKLKNFIMILSGYSPEQCSPLIQGDGIPYYKVENIQADSIDIKPSEYTVPKDFNIAKSDSLIFPKRGAAIALNKVGIAQPPFSVDTNVMGFSLKGSLGLKYLYYTIRSFSLIEIADTTTIPQINNKQIDTIRIPYPPLIEQETIVEHLDSVMKKLSAVRRKIESSVLLLREYRSSLITSAVSGQIDVSQEVSK